MSEQYGADVERLQAKLDRAHELIGEELTKVAGDPGTILSPDAWGERDVLKGVLTDLLGVIGTEAGQSHECEITLTLSQDEAERLRELAMGRVDEYPPEYGTKDARLDDALMEKVTALIGNPYAEEPTP